MTRPLPPSVDVLAPGQRVGPFVLLAPLGAGGSGRIWAAARLGQLGFNKRLVLKVMRQDRLSSASARRRFDREACLGGRLRHPNLRAVHDLQSCEGRPYMALSWVDTSLSELLQHAPDERLPPAVVCWIGMQCCSALVAAHGWTDQRGPRPIVHRDVSPGNILLSVDGHALLADLAAPDDEESSGESGPPRFFGSLAYAAPEALRQQALDARADLYSLGCVLYEALAGAPAFEGDDERAVMFQILERGAPALSTRAADIPADIARVVERCLERRREDRFESARELYAALSACCAQRTAFTLERETAALIREVLGARIREREEMMHRAFERFAPSALARTDTLPIAGAEAPRLLVRPSAAAISQPAAAAPGASSHRRRWPLLVALFAWLSVVALLARESSRPTERVETRANRPVPAPEHPAGDTPASGAASSPAANGTSANVEASEGVSREASQPARDAGPNATASAGAARQPTAGEHRDTNSVSATVGPPRSTRTAPSTPAAPARKPGAAARPVPPQTRASSSDPFSALRFDDDPYAERLRGSKPAAPPSPLPERAPSDSATNSAQSPPPSAPPEGPAPSSPQN